MLSLGPNKKRRKKILIILSKLNLDEALRLACMVFELYDGDDYDALTSDEQCVVDCVDDIYRLWDGNDDPDNFNVCDGEAITSVARATYEPKVADLASAIAEIS